jgi:hypothetical protein
VIFVHTRGADVFDVSVILLPLLPQEIGLLTVQILPLMCMKFITCWSR